MQPFIIIIRIVFSFYVCNILLKKNRGVGYYILAFLAPLVGLIFALCLKKLDPKEENLNLPTFDITEELNKEKDEKLL